MSQYPRLSVEDRESNSSKVKYKIYDLRRTFQHEKGQVSATLATHMYLLYGKTGTVEKNGIQLIKNVHVTPQLCTERWKRSRISTAIEKNRDILWERRQDYMDDEDINGVAEPTSAERQASREKRG